MKKIVSVLLCALLALGIIPFSAYAEDTTGSTIDVDMVWDELSFVYAPNYPGEWDIESHTYKNVPVGGWKVSDDTNNITITNNSSVKINAAFVFEAAEGNESVSLTFLGSGSAAVTDVVLDAEGTETVKVMPTGVLSSASGSVVKIGSITVTFSVAES